LPFTARNFLTHQPTGTPRRAISPSEHILIVRVLRAKRASGRSLHFSKLARSLSGNGG
jgi:hypothetical protein